MKKFKSWDSRKKIVDLPALRKRLQKIRRGGRKIAFTNGCFDILHAGHVRYLESAKTDDRILVVGLNSDASVRRLKGATRPINPERQRASVLAALSCVDFVVIFKEETPRRLISAIKPDILIKGADWKGKDVVGSDIVTKRGGRMELIRYVPGISTTGMLQKILRREKDF